MNLSDLNPIKAVVDKVGDLAIRYFPPEIDRQKFLLEVQKEADAVEIAFQGELTKRQQADMASDSWLSKNIRPLSFIFLSLLVLGMVGAAYAGRVLPDLYVSQIFQMWLAFGGIYAVVRGAEKGIKMWSDTKK
jgi:hypothetical protein